VKTLKKQLNTKVAFSEKNELVYQFTKLPTLPIYEI